MDDQLKYSEKYWDDFKHYNSCSEWDAIERLPFISERSAG